MTKIYSAWTNAANSAVSFVPGEGPPCAADGTKLPDCEVLLWKIEAATWEEACAINHLRLGHGSYSASGAAKPCPKCGANFYPEGSGECWRCGNVC